MKLGRFIFLAGLLVGLAACENRPPKRHPASSLTVSLAPGAAAVPVQIRFGTELRIVLPGPDAGSAHVWEIVADNVKVLEQSNGLRAVPGPPATTRISFFALRPGHSLLRFVLVRPGEKEAVPAARYDVAVTVTE